ncbi:hypothetical protein [Falsiroseomonas oryziterrae]|nr:hypothetical protein [Roseomonas sp. NPKOSM-4]
MRRILIMVAVLGGILGGALLGHLLLTTGVQAGGTVGRMAAATCAACH